ncbi:hypothetical protein SLS62_008531 [Diatrype stigma]|uniref:RanBD1 domain-containing protein n=1 Tax=Diatrype stigma TaxID=117547 RepID=A0AAN9YLB7_9PEZI
MKDQISSPKKKRVYDEVAELNSTGQDSNGDVSPIGANGRTDRSEPEKKRPRDVSSETRKLADDANTSTTSTESQDTTQSQPKNAESKTDKATETTKAATSNKNDTTTSTSASAFSSSGLAGFASQASPFLQAGGKTLSSFASAPGSQSPFGSLGAQASAPSVFGGASLSNGASPFGQIGGASKPFGGSPFGGSAFGGAFGSAIGGNKLTTFGNAGQGFKSSKAAKPFGAPESDEEEGGEENEDAGSEDDAKTTSEERDGREKSVPAEDKKKTKLQRVDVEDGEAGEISILAVRGKLYNLNKTTKTWKERGVGNLKINVPYSCVDINQDTGAPYPGSFDASALEDAETRVVRLVMRQDATHKVILNTVVIPAMSFQYKENGSNVAYLLFTAIEGNGDAVPMQIKMKAENAKNFLNEVEKIQRELQPSNADSGYHSSPTSRSTDGSPKKEGVADVDADAGSDKEALAKSPVRRNLRSRQTSPAHVTKGVTKKAGKKAGKRVGKKANEVSKGDSSDDSTAIDSDSSQRSSTKRKASEMEEDTKGPMTRAQKRKLSAASATSAVSS